jgi:predicted 3-demethylubiquinone-9 3-methyltransferase (glyoxalase superfamily)
MAMARIQRIAPCLWFDTQAEEAAKYYTGIFKHSTIETIARYGEAGKEDHGKMPGSVMVVEFELEGQPFTALNGGPAFKFNEAVSLQVYCETQKEIDYYWEKLGAGGDPAAQMCGWLKDKYGLSWQVAPVMMKEMFAHGVTPASERLMTAMMAMKKLDIAALQEAYAG